MCGDQWRFDSGGSVGSDGALLLLPRLHGGVARRCYHYCETEQPVAAAATLVLSVEFQRRSARWSALLLLLTPPALLPPTRGCYCCCGCMEKWPVAAAVTIVHSKSRGCPSEWPASAAAARSLPLLAAADAARGNDIGMRLFGGVVCRRCCYCLAERLLVKISFSVCPLDIPSPGASHSHHSYLFFRTAQRWKPMCNVTRLRPSSAGIS